MLKKLFLCLLVSTSLYPVEQVANDITSTTVLTAIAVGAGAFVVAMYTHDSKELDQLISKVRSGDVIKILEVIGVWMVLTQMGQSLISAKPTVYPVFKEIYEDLFPTEEQTVLWLAKEKAAHAKLKYLKAEEKFFDCMIKSKFDCEKNNTGYPITCEELAQALILCGGQDEVDRMTKALNGFEQ